MRSALFFGSCFAVLLAGCQTAPVAPPQTNALDLRDRASVEPGFGRQDGTVAGSKSLKPVAGRETRPCDYGPFSLKDLEVGELSISSQPVSTALQTLAVMGYTTVPLDPDYQMGAPMFGCQELPVILRPLEADDSALSFDPVATTFAGGYGSAGGGLDINNIGPSHAGELDRLLVFYHPDQPEAYYDLKTMLAEQVDLASTQVYIETMVMEVLEEDSRELGVQFESANVGPVGEIVLGATEFGSGDTVNFVRDSTTDEFGGPNLPPRSGTSLKLRALVENGRAEILSRPSVLALSNRQAVIQIVDVVPYPIIQSSFAGGDVVISGFSFEDLRLGITLNLRPRVSADRQWVSLEIDAVVEAGVDENDGQVFAPDPNVDGGRVLIGEKPGSARRQVKTFARIPDRTPIIIGGLVANDQETQKTRVPGVGRIPFLGALFGATDNEVKRREIIIVLTPYILAEDAISVASNKPKASQLFDDNEMLLFNDTYRLRADDIFDLQPLFSDPRFVAYRNAALTAVRVDPKRAAQAPYRWYANGNVPGGEELVVRMLYDITGKRELDVTPDHKKVYVRRRNASGEVQAEPLHEILKQADLDDGEALVVLFDPPDEASPEAAAQVSVERGQGSWARYESELQDEASGRSGVVIRDKRDIEELRRAVALDEILSLNGGTEALTVSDFRTGYALKLPAFEERERHVLTGRAAALKHAAKNYYERLIVRLRESYRMLDEDLAGASSASPSPQAPVSDADSMP